MTAEEITSFEEAVMQIVRDCNARGKAVTRQELTRALAERGLFPPSGPVAASAVQDAPLPSGSPDSGEALDAQFAGMQTRSGDRSGEAAEEAGDRLGLILSSPALASFTGLSGESLYHDPAFLSRTYARIMDRKSSPLTLMAEEIRANSRDYPRPVPVDLFESAPFSLEPETIAETLKAMAASGEHQDITFATTSSGAVYLFSTRHLERGFAEFLAERAEGLVLNP